MNNRRIILSTKDYDVYESGFVSILNKNLTLKDIISQLVKRINYLEHSLTETQAELTVVKDLLKI